MSTNYRVGPTGLVGGKYGAQVYAPNRKHPAQTLYNSGANPVFVDSEDPVNNTSQGIPLTAGSTITWDSDKPLYLIAPTQTTVIMTENSAGPFDVVAIADAITDAGLSTDIANDIVASGLSNDIASDILASGLSASIASQINIAGVPPIDRLTALVTPNTVINNGYNSGVLDVSKFQSIDVGINNTGTLVGGIIAFAWYADAAGAILIGIDFVGCATLAGGNTLWNGTVRGPFLKITGNATSGSSTMSAFGSYKTQGRNFYNVQGDLSFNSGGTVTGGSALGVTGWSGTIPAATTWSWRPDSIAGRIRLDTSTSVGVATTANLTVLTAASAFPAGFGPNNVNYIRKNSIPAPATVTDIDSSELILPPFPIIIQLRNNAAGATMDFTMALTYLSPWG